MAVKFYCNSVPVTVDYGLNEMLHLNFLLLVSLGIYSEPIAGHDLFEPLGTVSLFSMA